MDHSQKAAYVFNQYASLYQEKYMDVSLYKDSLNLFCESISVPKARILELASGPGNTAKYVLKNRPDLQLLGIDLAPNMVELARKNNPSAQFELMDCRDILNIDDKFDGILCGFCLPYLSKQEAITLIENAAQLLNTNGVLYLSTMEDDNLKSGYKNSSSGKHETYMNYHEASYLQESLKSQNFSIEKTERIQYKDPNGVSVTDLILIARFKP